MKVVVAVSGGVDSVVLLDMLVKKCKYELVVAHFDHGMREDSAADARFVERLAEYYGLEFEVQRQELAGASEDEARSRRYEFLFTVAEGRGAKLATAHHMDDVVETIALNIGRGTRWRGLAGMSDERIWRPLKKRTKSELIEYALGERLEWVEDETNRHDMYQRNRLRKRLASLPSASLERLYELWQHQRQLRREISREMRQAHFPISSRYFLIMAGDLVAKELLYEYVLDGWGVSLLGSQLEYGLSAIKAGRPGTSWQIGQGVVIKLTARDWRVQLGEK